MKPQYYLVLILFSLFACQSPENPIEENPKPKPPISRIDADSNGVQVLPVNEQPTSFSHLKTLRFDLSTEPAIHFGADAKIVNQRLKESSEEAYDLIKVKINTKEKQVFSIHFSWGPSDDPQYLIYKEGKEKEAPLDVLYGYELYIPGNGYLYTAGHVNSFFDLRQKYKVEKDSIREIQQPYKYVGIKTALNKPITLFESIEYKNKIASLPKGAPVEVLVYQEENHFLIKTSFGLVGWWEMDQHLRSEIINELYFAGD